MTYEHVTLCFSLPRSRSQWLAWLYGHAVESWHDPLKHCESPLDLKALIDSHGPTRLFIADTSAILFHSAIVESLPGARRLYVVRPLDDVCASLKRETGFPRRSLMEAMAARLSHEANGATWGRFDDLDNAAFEWWPEVTGRLKLGAGFQKSRNAIRIDTPVREQAVWPEKRRALMTHRETFPALPGHLPSWGLLQAGEGPLKIVVDNP